MGGQQKKSDCKKTGRQARKPATAHYRRVGFPRMRLRKIGNLIRCCRMTREAATVLWERTRQRRPAHEPTHRIGDIQGPKERKRQRHAATPRSALR